MKTKVLTGWVGKRDWAAAKSRMWYGGELAVFRIRGQKWSSDPGDWPPVKVQEELDAALTRIDDAKHASPKTRRRWVKAIERKREEMELQEAAE